MFNRSYDRNVRSFTWTQTNTDPVFCPFFSLSLTPYQTMISILLYRPSTLIWTMVETTETMSVFYLFSFFASYQTMPPRSLFYLISSAVTFKRINLLVAMFRMYVQIFDSKYNFYYLRSITT